MEWVGILVGYGVFLVPIAYIVVRAIRRGEGWKVFDFLFGLVAVVMLSVLTRGWLLLPLFAWAVVDFFRWLGRPREPAPHL
jgi:hypothetical protein